MTNSQLFTKAHKLAATFEGDYCACFALALKEIREMKDEVLETYETIAPCKEGEVQKYITQYDTIIIETILNGASYDVELHDDETEEERKEAYSFEFQGKDSELAYKLLSTRF